MFDLESAIQLWLRLFSKHRAFNHGSIREMELHLRDHIDDLIAEGHEPQEAFEMAVEAFGEIKIMAKEELHTQTRKRTFLSIIDITMLNNYLLIALRNMRKHKFYAMINVLGLAVGMSICLLIYQYIDHELSFDTFYSEGSQVYRLTAKAYQNEEEVAHGVESPYRLGPQGKEDIPEIIESVRIHPQYGGAVVSNPATNERFIELQMLYVDDNFLEVFDFELIHGQSSTVLADNKSMVLTEKMAKKYFGSSSPIGQTLTISGEWDEVTFTVTGILKSLPEYSHLQFDCLLPIQSLLANSQYKEYNGWGWFNFVTYVKLVASADLETVEKKYTELMNHFMADQWNESNRSAKIKLQPLPDIHLNSQGIGDPITTNIGNIEDIGVYTIIAIFIIAIAWINYVNLSTARAMHRAKEVGIRKSIGANRNQLMKQFLIEAGLLNVLSAFIAILLAYLMLPLLNDILGINLELYVLGRPEFWGWFILVLTVGSLLSGAYPSFLLSSFKVTAMLKSASTKQNKFNLRKILIVFQFAASIMLIAGTYLVYNQIAYMKNSDHGMAMDKILVLSGPKVGITKESIKTKLETLKNRLKSHHSILEVSGSDNIPSRGYNWGTEWRKLGATALENENAKLVFVDHDFLETYDIELLAGEQFPRERKFSRRVMINEATMKAFNIPSMEEALAEKFITGEDTIQVMGVLKNYNWSSLKDSHEPYFFALFGESLDYFSLKINMTDPAETIAHAEQVYTELFPNDAFEFFFLEDEFNRQYQADLQFGNLFAFFSGLAIFIACLGLFALVSYSVSLRLKEVGIRKVLGAKVGQLMLLLSREYLLLLLFANVLALPVAWYWANEWLKNYAFRISPGIDLLLIPGGLLLLISAMTVSYQTYATAKSNPVDSLRSE